MRIPTIIVHNVYDIFQYECRKRGGYLVKVDDSDENNWLHANRLNSKFNVFVLKPITTKRT